jgi:hypothetical protein
MSEQPDCIVQLRVASREKCLDKAQLGKPSARLIDVAMAEQLQRQGAIKEIWDAAATERPCISASKALFEQLCHDLAIGGRFSTVNIKQIVNIRSP